MHIAVAAELALRRTIDHGVDARVHRAISIWIEVRWSWTLLSTWVWLLLLGCHNRIDESSLLTAIPFFACVESWAAAVDEVADINVLTILLLGGAIIHLPPLDTLAGISNQDAAGPSTFLGYKTNWITGYPCTYCWWNRSGVAPPSTGAVSPKPMPRPASSSGLELEPWRLTQ